MTSRISDGETGCSMYRALLDLRRRHEGVSLVNPAGTIPSVVENSASCWGMIQSTPPRKSSKVNIKEPVPQTDTGDQVE